MNREPYTSDLAYVEWEELAGPGGRPRTVEMREVIIGILDVLHSGYTWRMMLHDLPPWGTACGYFRRWRKDSTWECIHDILRPEVRELEGNTSLALFAHSVGSQT